MFAVLKTGGKQYKVASGDILRVEKLAAVAGETVQFNEIMMVGDTIGEPFVEDAAVQAQVIDQIKGKKVIHFVRRRRKHGSKRTKGHRQKLTLLRVTEILESGAAESGIKAAIGAGSAPRHPALAELAGSERLLLTDSTAESLAEGSTHVAVEDGNGHPSEQDKLIQDASEPGAEAGITEPPSEATGESQEDAQITEVAATAGSDIVEQPEQAAEGRGEVEDRDEEAK